MLLVVDGLDEDLGPPGAVPVAALLPTLVDERAHVLMSSRPHPQPPVADQPLADCERVTLEPFPGAAELAAHAKAEIDGLVDGPAPTSSVRTCWGCWPPQPDPCRHWS